MKQTKQDPKKETTKSTDKKETTQKATPVTEEKVENTVNEGQKEQPEKTDDAQQKEKEAIDWEKKYQEANASYLLLMADFDNYRKHMMKDKADLIKNAGEKIIKDLLPIIDNFERALKSMESAEDVDAVRKGVELIYNQIMTMMKSNGVSVIETENQPFNTDFHEAITTIPSPTPDMKDKIIDCTTKGYIMNEKVIRHSKVVVGA